MTRKSGQHSMQYTEHWTAVSTFLGLISSAYHDLHHWRSWDALVTVSSVGIKHTFKTQQVKWSRINHDKLIWHHLCAMWIGGSVVEF